MVTISIEKLEECRQWRSTEPMLPPDANVFDIADQQFLKDLIDTIGLDVIGRLRRLCSGRSCNVSEGQEDDNLSDDELRIAFFGNGIQKVKRLGRGVEQALEELQQISNEHRFGEVTTEYKEEQEDEPPLAKRRRINPNGEDGLHFDASTIEESDRPNNLTVNEKTAQDPKRPVSRPSVRVAVGEKAVRDSEDEDSFHDSDDDSSPSEGDGFGVRGDWGNEHDSDEDDDSSFGLVQEELTVTK
jgi:hypothetical protein